jgi:hypothetical protein
VHRSLLTSAEEGISGRLLVGIRDHLRKLLEVSHLEQAQWKVEVRELLDLLIGDLDRGGFLGIMDQAMTRDRLAGLGKTEGEVTEEGDHLIFTGDKESRRGCRISRILGVNSLICAKI